MKPDQDHSLVRSPADFGQQIRQARKAQGLTQAELAAIAGVGPGLCPSWSAARTPPAWDWRWNWPG
ncbi:hypothetical protein A3717_36505 [Alcanivorax sp. HI0013]|nr:hypothetical protein A3717_36505 [Alcanivorax sp. HI0013]